MLLFIYYKVHVYNKKELTNTCTCIQSDGFLIFRYLKCKYVGYSIQY